MNLPAGAHAHFTREAEQTARLESAQRQARQEFARGELNNDIFCEADPHDLVALALDHPSLRKEYPQTCPPSIVDIGDLMKTIDTVIEHRARALTEDAA